MSLFPKMLGRFQRIDFESFPPRNLTASLMQLPMVPAAERHRLAALVRSALKGDTAEPVSVELWWQVIDPNSMINQRNL